MHHVRCEEDASTETHEAAKDLDPTGPLASEMVGDLDGQQVGNQADAEDEEKADDFSHPALHGEKRQGGDHGNGKALKR